MIVRFPLCGDRCACRVGVQNDFEQTACNESCYDKGIQIIDEIGDSNQLKAGEQRIKGAVEQVWS
ncbi:hypothetical protein D3C86_2107840 [compost metagenome]